ncbi:hypothetical protein ACFP2F_10965 [Hymenobacter artigasi]|uniref:Uncharacterized protein n=1 Tax=Hymenobacter artigasi TaxID=2719616 RepID=A0ABX1HMI6_9BACT|nr:hypothetical protein [Hymenobacter artigasi]NKI90206.1 hypothetical protein [Hymenobacter artigasi]
MARQLTRQGYDLTYYVSYMGKHYWHLSSTGEDALLVGVAGTQKMVV